MDKQQLAEALEKAGRIRLGQYPTPLHPLARLQQKLNAPPIYIKREDLSGLGPGGNKVRNLEFLLAEALQQGCDTVLVAGGPQSNLCTATACACARLGLQAVLVHQGEQPAALTGNLLLNRLLNTTSIYVGEVNGPQRNAYLPVIAVELARQGRRPYIIENGASSGRGALGYMAGFIEILEQIQALQYPIRTIFVPGGNGGLAAGLTYANALLGQPLSLVVVSVEYTAPVLRGHLQRMIDEAQEILHIPISCQVEDACLITDEYMGEGWGCNTTESAEMVYSFPQLEGLFLENVYNSKPLVAMQDFILGKKVQGGVCYLHSGGFSSLFAQF